MAQRNMVPGVAFYGKVRIPTIGHKKAVDQAKKIAESVGGQLHIGLTGFASPLTVDQKKSYAETLFDYPVETGESTRTIINFLSSLSEQHDELHLVAGSDRAAEFRRILMRYNGREDSKKNVLFEFKKWKVHEVARSRKGISSTQVETLVEANDYAGFKASYPGVSEQYIRKLFENIRKNKKKLLSENIDVPAIGMTFSRELMPQISGDSLPDFLKFLGRKGINFHKQLVDPSKLKSSQMEFDDMKIIKLMFQDSTDPIIVSNDDYVLDGHHRWLADHNSNEQTEAYVIDLPILELYRISKEYGSLLNESMNHENFAPLATNFVSFASQALGIKSLPNITYGGDYDASSFGGYMPSSKSFRVITKNRHPIDIFRTIAHELVHHKQNEDGRITDIENDGKTGSEIEDEANSLAGRLMRNYGREYPEHFKLSGLTEAIFILGGTEQQRQVVTEVMKSFDSEVLSMYQVLNRSTLSDSVVVSDSTDNLLTIKTVKTLLEHNGYNVKPIFIEQDNEISKIRKNKNLFESIRFKNVENSKKIISELKTLFGSNLLVLSEETKKSLKKRMLYPRNREWGTESLTKIYKMNTPGELGEDLPNSDGVGLITLSGKFPSNPFGSLPEAYIKPKPLKKILENIDSVSGFDMGTIPDASSKESIENNKIVENPPPIKRRIFSNKKNNK